MLGKINEKKNNEISSRNLLRREGNDVMVLCLITSAPCHGPVMNFTDRRLLY